jgi:hypothetical protein
MTVSSFSALFYPLLPIMMALLPTMATTFSAHSLIGVPMPRAPCGHDFSAAMFSLTLGNCHRVFQGCIH